MKLSTTLSILEHHITLINVQHHIKHKLVCYNCWLQYSWLYPVHFTVYGISLCCHQLDYCAKIVDETKTLVFCEPFSELVIRLDLTIIIRSLKIVLVSNLVYGTTELCLPFIFNYLKKQVKRHFLVQ